MSMIKGGPIALLAALFALALAGPAAAEEIPPRVFKGSFGEGHLALAEHGNLQSEQGQSGVAVNQESGHVYVADTEHDRIAEYTASGGSESTFASIAEPTFLAVDNSAGGSGDLYVVSNGREKITKLDSSGRRWSRLGRGGSMEGFSEIDGIAVDGSGNLFVLTGGSEAELYELAPGRRAEQRMHGAPYTNRNEHAAPYGIAVDTEGHLYFVRFVEIVVDAASVPTGCRQDHHRLRHHPSRQ